nr:E3 SUMO-protein ligase NSE2 [Parasteatoda tepidariorum]
MEERLPTISSEIQQLLEVESTLGEVFKHCDKMKSDILEFSQADAAKELRTLKESMKHLAELQRQISSLSSAAQKIEELVTSDCEDEEEVLSQFESVITSCKEEETIDEYAERAIEQVEDYIARSENSVAEALDDDVLVTETTDIIIDPLTKLQIKEAVKSRICNHSYDKNSILAYLKSRKNRV